MTPYYQHDGITIYHGDCLKVLPALEAGAADLVLTDPPYNVGIKYGQEVDDKKTHYRWWCRQWFKECKRLSGLIALTPGIVNVAMWEGIEATSWIMCWHKPAAMGRSPVGFNNWEPILVWGKPKTNKGVDVVVAPIIPDDEIDGHPCPKPLKWATGIIRNLAPEANAILDPFMGTGTVVRAAKNHGCRAIGIEIEEAYCEIAARRLEQGVLQFETAVST